MNIKIDILNIYCMCMYLNVYSTHTYIMQTKTFILDAINGN